MVELFCGSAKVSSAFKQRGHRTLLMPPHDIYIELFLGQGEILCRKKPAQVNIGTDINPKIAMAGYNPIGWLSCGRVTLVDDTVSHLCLCYFR